MTARIGHEEWLAALQAANAGGGPDVAGFTVQELVDMLGVGPDAVRIRLRAWIRSGVVEFVGLRPVTTSDGRRARGTPVYQVVR